MRSRYGGSTRWTPREIYHAACPYHPCKQCRAEGGLASELMVADSSPAGPRDLRPSAWRFVKTTPDAYRDSNVRDPFKNRAGPHPVLRSRSAFSWTEVRHPVPSVKERDCAEHYQVALRVCGSGLCSSRRRRRARTSGSRGRKRTGNTTMLYRVSPRIVSIV